MGEISIAIAKKEPDKSKKHQKRKEAKNRKRRSIDNPTSEEQMNRKGKNLILPSTVETTTERTPSPVEEVTFGDDLLQSRLTEAWEPSSSSIQTKKEKQQRRRLSADKVEETSITRKSKEESSRRKSRQDRKVPIKQSEDVPKERKESSSRKTKYPVEEENVTPLTKSVLKPGTVL